MFTPGEEQTTDPLEAPGEVNKKAVKLSPFWAFLKDVPQVPDVALALRYRILYLELQVEELKAKNKRLNMALSFAQRAYAQARREKPIHPKDVCEALGRQKKGKNPASSGKFCLP